MAEDAGIGVGLLQAVRSPSSGHRRAASRQFLPVSLGLLHCDSFSRFSQKLNNKSILEKNRERGLDAMGSQYGSRA